MKATYLTPDGVRHDVAVFDPDSLRDLMCTVSTMGGEARAPGLVLTHSDASTLAIGFVDDGMVVVWIISSDCSFHATIGTETGDDVGYDLLGAYSEADRSWVLPEPVALRAIQSFFETGNPATGEFTLERD